jgi:hypothetical protein
MNREWEDMSLQWQAPKRAIHGCMGKSEKGYRVPISMFRSVFVAFSPFSWTCECEDFYFNSKQGCGYECRHILSVKALLRAETEEAIA